MERIPEKFKISADEYKLITKNYGPNPCHSCELSVMDKSTCCGCHGRNEWNAKFESIPASLRDIARSYNSIYELDKEIADLESKLLNVQNRRTAILDNFNEKIICDEIPKNDNVFE